jgi:aldose 1-epimerase
MNSGTTGLHDGAAVLELVHGPIALRLDPACGGSIRRCSYDGPQGRLDLFRPAAPDARDPRDMACFPLVPFSNRIADASFRWDGRDIALRPNFEPEPHALHGQGWQRPWRVVGADATRATLELVHCEPGTPFDFAARQQFEIVGRGLTVRMEIENRGATAMPSGLGLHPYFVRRPDARLQAGVSSVWRMDARKLPVERIALPARWDLRRAPRVDDLELDHCFDPWDGDARISWPGSRLAIAVRAEPEFDRLVVFVPPGADFFCIEPVSHANAAVNRDDPEAHGVRVLPPGGSFRATVRFEVVEA